MPHNILRSPHLLPPLSAEEYEQTKPLHNEGIFLRSNNWKEVGYGREPEKSDFRVGHVNPSKP